MDDRLMYDDATTELIAVLTNAAAATSPSVANVLTRLGSSVGALAQAMAWCLLRLTLDELHTVEHHRPA